MSLRRIVIALELVYSHVELGAVLYHRFVQRRQQNIIVEVMLWHRNHQKTVILACVTIYWRSHRIRSKLIGTKHVLSQGLFEIYKLRLVKLKITHTICFSNIDDTCNKSKKYFS